MSNLKKTVVYKGMYNLNIPSNLCPDSQMSYAKKTVQISNIMSISQIIYVWIPSWALSNY
jgi:hypothetical protein